MFSWQKQLRTPQFGLLVDDIPGYITPCTTVASDKSWKRLEASNESDWTLVVDSDGV